MLQEHFSDWTVSVTIAENKGIEKGQSCPITVTLTVDKINTEHQRQKGIKKYKYTV